MTPIHHRQSERPVSLDQVFSALSDTMRRRVLTAVMSDNPRREDEFKTVEFRPDDTEQEAIAIQLRHQHLPQLDEAGFIDWEREPERITRGERFNEIRPLLELIDNHQEELPSDWP